MVSAIRGVLLQCDVPTKEFIISLNESKPTNERFIIHDLDDIRLFVQPSVVEWLEERLKQFNEENTYQPPRREDMR
ncbi:g1285 [Coccomyxa viridis]|uniref:General transcription and DNA repair factor IIH subunit TFB5 n=1 Tax=Coccomyxa viridis TaxID=1274662 RepID=A0ABP1FLF5_9CHLO